MTALAELVMTDETPFDFYLRRQSDLSAVDRFAKSSSARPLAGAPPQQQRYYRNLLPATAPGPGQQYGFEVDLDACTGCKACVTACHSLNGLDDDESWRSVGLLHSAASNSGSTALQTVTTGCHHCVDPACLNGCPVEAYEKNPITGIVAHLDDQCIGCGYCTLMCPYEVPRYNASRGIVRKCDMCQDRLGVGEAPACVQACPNEAIRISLVDKGEVVARSLITRLVPGAPVSHHTSPTTVYRTSRETFRSLVAVDEHALRPSPPHPPLAVMLVLTQLSVGAFVIHAVLRHFADPVVVGALRPYNAAVALAMGILALGASVGHLGRPLFAFRAVIGVRHSWLSREIVAFGAFSALAAVYAATVWLGPTSAAGWLDVLGVGVAAAGALGVVSSVMVYAVTPKHWWRARTTGTKFGLTALIGGLAIVMLTSELAAVRLGAGLPARTWTHVVTPAAKALAVVCLLKLLFESLIFTHLRPPRARPRSRRYGRVGDSTTAELRRTASLLSGALLRFTVARFALTLVCGVALPITLVTVPFHALVSSIGCALVLAGCVGGELIERYQFFRAVSAPRMPGGLA